ncbi:hypothetical protein [Singulisphaera sp. GP187]|uniref:hypothetical protein n=1 Tax=Singulisphaera sp. GP187 TaxID=1882752 RepID=UPI0009408F2A|nr:hypothetical protein [Singulisphaera sp. GP187]
MDPQAAMMTGLGPDPFAQPPPQGPPVGPEGLPVGGSMPSMDGDPSMGDSGLLQALHSALSGGGDPYGVAPGEPDQGFQGMGTGDPNMGLQQLLQILALGQNGVGGGPGVGSSGVDPDPFGGTGMMAGL